MTLFLVTQKPVHHYRDVYKTMFSIEESKSGKEALRAYETRESQKTTDPGPRPVYAKPKVEKLELGKTYLT